MTKPKLQNLEHNGLHSTFYFENLTPLQIINNKLPTGNAALFMHVHVCYKSMREIIYHKCTPWYRINYG